MLIASPNSNVKFSRGTLFEAGITATVPGIIKVRDGLEYLIGQNFRRTKFFGGQNFWHQADRNFGSFV